MTVELIQAVGSYIITPICIAVVLWALWKS